MLLVLLSIFLISFLAPAISKLTSARHYLLAGFTAVILGYFISFIPWVADGQPLSFYYSWIEDLSIGLSFYVDGLSLFFALLILFFGILIILYSGNYLKKEEYIGRFYFYLIFFMGSMMGLVLSSNLVGIFVFWELTSFSSYLLIGFHNREAKSRNVARQALLVTGTGGLALMAGFILMGIAGGSYDLLELINSKEFLQNHPYMNAIIILVLAGVFTKSAQFPFHFWLPNAMEAPTPVSAYLHSSTMVKAGIYLILRLNPVFATSGLWSDLLIIFGTLTMLMGAVVAFKSDDLKRILAYTTISALGIFVMLTGIGTEKAITGVFIYLLAHALYKGGLFLATGILDHACGTRKLSELAGIKKQMPVSAVGVILACASMAGVIPLLGFLGKEILYNAVYKAALYQYVLLGLLVLSNILFVAIALRIVISAFFSAPKNTQSDVIKEESPLLTIPVLIMGILGLIFGVFAPGLLKPISGAAIANIISSPTTPDLSLWHGFNVVLLLSIITLALGALVYLIQNKKKSLSDFIKTPFERVPEIVYDKLMLGVQGFADYQTRKIQSGYLRNYISVYTAVFIALVSYRLIISGLYEKIIYKGGWQQLLNAELVILTFIAVTLLFIFFVRSRLMVVAAIGIIGYAIALSYTIFSAPDVAITQFLAETLSLILLILIAPKLPGIFRSGFRIKRKYLAISVMFGLLMSMITLIGMNLESNSMLKDYFLKESLEKGKGSNVVNVILVDFRALDTLGEISVLTITMVGIISLLNYKKKNT